MALLGPRPKLPKPFSRVVWGVTQPGEHIHRIGERRALCGLVQPRPSTPEPRWTVAICVSCGYEFMKAQDNRENNQ